MKRIDLTGQKFGRLTVIEVSHFERHHLRWKCLCECGNTAIVTTNGLRSGKSNSCGCYMIDRIKETNSKQGGHSANENKATYTSWRSAISRCYNKNHPKYKDYGARGIIMCDRWLNSFENFLADMGRKPENKTIDRFPDNNGIYELSNCRWATIWEQQKNLRSNVWYEHDGKRMIMADWIRELGIGKKAVIRYFKQKEK